jgi:hypothetical protein
MKLSKFSTLVLAAFALSMLEARAQYMYKFTFKGMCYQADNNGNVVNIPFTDQTIINERAAAGGVDPATLALVYHVGGDTKGDTVEVVSSSDGSVILAEFGFFFGDDPSFNRMALTNAASTDIRRVDQLFTFSDSPHTCQASHGMGTSYTAKTTIGVTNGIPYFKIEGTLQWIVNPVNGASSKACYGTFTATQLLF